MEQLSLFPNDPNVRDYNLVRTEQFRILDTIQAVLSKAEGNPDSKYPVTLESPTLWHLAGVWEPTIGGPESLGNYNEFLAKYEFPRKKYSGPFRRTIDSIHVEITRQGHLVVCDTRPEFPDDRMCVYDIFDSSGNAPLGQYEPGFLTTFREGDVPTAVSLAKELLSAYGADKYVDA